MKARKDKIRLIEMCDDGRFGCFYVVMCVNVNIIDKTRLDKII